MKCSAFLRHSSHRIFRFLLLLVVLTPGSAVHGQHFTATEADSLMDALGGSRVSDHGHTLPLARRLFAHFQQQGDTCRMVEALITLGSCHDALGAVDSALHALLRANAWRDRRCAQQVHARLALNLSAVYLTMNEYNLADSVCREALEATPTLPAGNLSDLLFNRAVALAGLGRSEEAEAQFARLETLAREAGNVPDEIDALLNQGALRGQRNDLAGAARFLEQALARCVAVDCPKQAEVLQNMALLMEVRGEPERALPLLEQALPLVRTHGDLEVEISLLSNKARILHVLGDFHEAWAVRRLHDSLSKELLNVEKVRALADMQEKYQSEQRLREIRELELEKLDAELNRVQLKRTRNIYLFAGSLVLILAVGLWNRLRLVNRSRALIRREKEVSEGLLHNILPVEVADELRASGTAQAREFAQATILFTDFKGFTAIAEQLSPAALVAEIDTCFKAFDAVMAKYRVEKIKTIGDAYMAAGGLPDPTHGSPLEVVLAALELQAFMEEHRRRREDEGRPTFAMRVGIHTGPVVAGIVGVRKFAYDIWGDSVNVASRMESSGEVGRVNISGATHALVKDAPDLVFTHRGQVHAKGKGSLDMYFVSLVHQSIPAASPAPAAHPFP
jgi:adenylate cyclase